MRDEESDTKFVEWSKGRSVKSWDAQAVARFTESNGLCHGLDVGGGIGKFANLICDLNDSIQSIDVVDPSKQAHDNFIAHPKTQLIKSTLEEMTESAAYDFITINLVCHHIIEKNNKETFNCQKRFLRRVRNRLTDGGYIFIEENIYESYFSDDLCGRLIYEITSLKGIDSITRRLGANTAGEGVRFRSDNAWKKIFQEVGLRTVQTFEDYNWGKNMPLWQKLPLLCRARYQRVYVLQAT
jgi:hypothetical protein